MDLFASKLTSLKNAKTPLQQSTVHLVQLLQTVVQLNAKIISKFKTGEDIEDFVQKNLNSRTKLFKDIEALSDQCEKSKEWLKKAKDAEEKRKLRAEKKAATPPTTAIAQNATSVAVPISSVVQGAVTVHIHLPPASGAGAEKPPAAGGSRKKKTIPKSIKEKIWHKYVGKDKTEANCLVCKEEKISIMSFHAGHVVAEVNGGETAVENLRPICGRCNLQMGSMDMNEYSLKWYKHKVD